MTASARQPVTAVLPARNEQETIEAAVRSLAAQPEIAEIRVVNDGSSDSTGEILERLAAELPQLRIIHAGALPPCWVGKNHAAWLGAQDCATEWLLFTDADVRHLPGSAAHALANGELRGASLVSYSPRQRLETWWERAVISFVYSRLAVRYPYKKVNDPKSPLAAANGQYLLIRREAYLAIGGHRAIAGEVLEDVALARRAKSAGISLYFATGEDVAETRMYTTFSAMWEGWTKNLYPLIGGTPFALARELLSVLPLPELALLVVAVIAHRSLYPGFWLWALPFLLFRTGYALRGQGRYPILEDIIQYWGGMVIYSAALVASAWRHAKGTVTWKGRTYPVSS